MVTLELPIEARNDLLVAGHIRDPAGGSLVAGIGHVRILKDVFTPPDDFNLREYTEQGFGVFQEEPVDVVWQFSPRAAAEVRELVFQPNQKIEEADEGALLVRFRAGGRLETAWHHFTFAPDVEGLQPEELRGDLNRLLAEALHARSNKRSRFGVPETRA